MKNLQTAKVIGTPTKTAWSQVHILGSEEGKRGDLIVAVSVVNPQEEAEATTIGKEVLEKLSKGFFESEKESLIEQASQVSGAEIEIATLLVLQNYAYLAGFGGGQIALWRDNRLSLLLKSEKDKVSSLSGRLEPKDVLIVGTSAFFKTVGAQTLTDAFSKSASPEDVADGFAPVVHSKSLPSLACAFVKAQISEERKEGKLKDWAVNLALKLPAKKIHIKREESPRRTAVAVGAVLIFLLLVSIAFGAKQKSLRDYRSSYEDRLVKAETLFADALLQREIDKTRSRELFGEAKVLVDALTADGVKDDRLLKLETKMREDEAGILGKTEVSPNVFLDLSLVRSEVSARELVFDKETLAVFDAGGARIISVAASGKKTEVLGDRDEVGSARNIGIYSGVYYALTDRGVLQVGRGSEKTVVEKDEEWEDVSDIEVFGANIYLLTRRNPGQIWRYPGPPAGGEGGFGARQRWFGAGVEPDFSQAADMAIDGSIWVLLSGGNIRKFTRGAPDAFSIRGLDKSFDNPKALYTDENLESIFVLDKNNGRIVETNKKGEFVKAYLWDGMGEVEDIAVAKEIGKIFLLTETKILEIPLQ